jgi:hypothetical protein
MLMMFGGVIFRQRMRAIKDFETIGNIASISNSIGIKLMQVIIAFFFHSDTIEFFVFLGMPQY